MADGIRPCVREDFAQITHLYQEVFQTQQTHDRDDFQRYLEQAYLDNP
ncbi:MAG: hypothetical protein GY826_23540, partial [Fuerstiella sp.]|nr:hypothetical protein [Fuerstiella sp.]